MKYSSITYSIGDIGYSTFPLRKAKVGDRGVFHDKAKNVYSRSIEHKGLMLWGHNLLILCIIIIQ